MTLLELGIWILFDKLEFGVWNLIYLRYSSFMYSLETSLTSITGIGDKTAQILADKNIHSLKDLLLFLPLRYEDRSAFVTIDQLTMDELATFQATVKSVSSFYKNRRSMQTAIVEDETGKIKLMWFNNKWIKDRLKKGESYLFSGKLSKYQTVTQPTVENVKVDTIHTGRLVPIYASLGSLKQGTVRRLLKHVIDHLQSQKELEPTLDPTLPSLIEALKQLHFPDDKEKTILSRERLALEELLTLIQHSTDLKQEWAHQPPAPKITGQIETYIQNLPFTLTQSQLQAVQDLVQDLAKNEPMNRLLLGDVGSGKTVVTGLGCQLTIANNQSVALIVPTQILAKQHFQTFQKLFPQLPLHLVTAKTKKNFTSQPKVYIGTHALIRQLKSLQPALIIYDEQHRFGVQQRSYIPEPNQEFTPHVLTLSATPIPRSLMLTLFSHLQLSQMTELPAGRMPVKTWVVPSTKRDQSTSWLLKQIATAQQTADTHLTAIIVCPFISQSKQEGFAEIASATGKFEEWQSIIKQHPQLKINLAVLHGKQTATQKEKVTQQLFDNQIDILVTTPVIEVGLDVPSASIMVIESADRFGMASLHQLRGRVGRDGQQAYCLCFSTNGKPSPRLKEFEQTNDGLKLAELDLQRRGAGDLFSTQQHGFDTLRFADWTNLELITKARTFYDQLQRKQQKFTSPIFRIEEKNQEILGN